LSLEAIVEGARYTRYSGFFYLKGKKMELMNLNKSQTMSSLEIADLTGKRHEDVLRDIRKTMNDAEIEATHFCVPYKMPSGQTSTVYNLPRRECDLVVSGYSVKYRLAIIDRWQQLEAEKQACQRKRITN
jgi:phage regulator Rha-like protein